VFDVHYRALFLPKGRAVTPTADHGVDTVTLKSGAYSYSMTMLLITHSGGAAEHAFDNASCFKDDRSIFSHCLVSFLWLDWQYCAAPFANPQRASRHLGSLGRSRVAAYASRQ
jgi:hypothetical protein